MLCAVRFYVIIAKLLSLYSRSALLVHGGNAHAAADAQRGQAVLGIGALLHLVQQRDDDTGTGSADGWPREMAPPLTLTLLMSKCSSRATAMDCAANASLASIRSISSTVRPAFFSAARVAGTGPTPMILGSTPPWPQPTSWPWASGRTWQPRRRRRARWRQRRR